MGRLRCLRHFPFVGGFLSVRQCVIPYVNGSFERGETDASLMWLDSDRACCRSPLDVMPSIILELSVPSLETCPPFFQSNRMPSKLVLTVGSFYPCIYYGFYCEVHFQATYLTLITLAGLGQSPSPSKKNLFRDAHLCNRSCLYCPQS